MKGPQVMKGYLNRPEATAECMTADDFFKTGDVAIFDKKTQLFKIVDRLKVNFGSLLALTIDKDSGTYQV